MNHTGNQFIRVLGIDICNRGLGFVVLESPQRLVDWGTRRCSPGVADAELTRAEEIIKLYRPRLLSIENVHAPSCRRGARAKRLTKSIAENAERLGVKVFSCTPRDVRDALLETGVRTKYEIAGAVALRLTPLIPALPPPRKPWMSEDPRMSIFDAAAFALLCLQAEGHAIYQD